MLVRLYRVSRAQRSTISAFTRVFARYGGALQTRDRSELRLWTELVKTPDQRCTATALHRVRGTPI
jgi:hypothetical protein